MKLKLAVLIAALIIVIVFFGGVKTALAQTCSGSSTYPYTSYNCTFTGSTYTCVSNSNSGTASCGYLSGVCSACRNCGQACTGGASGCNITNNCPGGSGCGTGYSQDTTGCFVSGGATATPGGPTPTTGPAPTSPPVGCNDNSKPTQFIGYIVLDQNINGAVDDSCSAPVNVGHNIGFTNNCVGGYNFSQNDVVCGGFNRTITGRIGVNGNTWATWNGTCNPPGGWLCGPSRSRSGDFSFWDYNTVPTPLTFWSRPDVTCSVFGPASLLTGQSGTFTTTCSGSALGSGNSYIVIHNSGGSTISSTAGGASSASVTFPFPAAGTYYARAGFVNNANAANCSGNPFYSPNRGGYPQLPGGVIDCRSSGDWITVTVSNSPTNTPVPTLPPPPTFPPPTPGCVPPAPPTSLSPNGNTNCAPPGLPIPVTFSWSPSGASNYILRIDDKSDGWIGANDTYIDTLGTNSYTRNVVAGRTYDWWVYVGPMSCYSAATAATAIVPVCPTPPAPTGAPTNFQASALCSPPRGYLSWNSVAGASNYRVERCQGSTCSAFTQIGTTTGTNYSDSTVSDLTTYRYRVRGYFLSTGTFTPYTNTLTVTLACVLPTSTPPPPTPTSPPPPTSTLAPPTPSPLPGAPTNFQASPLCSPPRGYLSWNSVAGASNYRVERCQGSTCSAFTQIGTTTGTNYSDSTVSDLTTYRYRVRGYFLSTGTFTPYTNTLTVTLACVPPATPTTSPSQCILPAPVDPGPAICGEATWSWAAIQCGGVVATEYEIDIYNSTTGAIVIDNGWRPASDFGCSGGGLCKYITPLPAGTYYSRVRAGNSAGGFTPSNWSVPFTQSVDSCDLPTPTTSPSQCILPAPVDPGPAICGEATWSWAAIQCGGVVATEYEIDIYNSTTGAIVIDNGWRPASDFGCSGGGLCKYITPLPAGTYYSRVRAGNSAGGFTPSNWSVPFTQSVDSCSLPTCNATLLVSVYSMTPGETQTTLASISSLSPPDAVINEVHFSSNNPAVIAYPAAPADADSTFSYTNTATALAPGTADLTATVHATSTGYNHVTACIDTQTVSVVEPDPWWQVRDADVLSEGDLTDPISSTATNPYFNLAGAGGYPGIPILNGTASFGNGSVSQIPPFGWIVNSATSFSGTSANPIYGYNFLKNLAPTEVRNCTGSSNGCIPAGDTIPAGNLLLAGFNSGGYTWRRALGDLRIHGTGNINNNKMVVLVEGNLYLGYNNLTPTNTRINLNDGQGFVAFIVKGNIIISEEVASAGDSVGVGDINGSPGLEGIYMADGTISTGHFSAGADYQLRIRGMLIGWGGITFQRDLGGSGNGTQPSEYIQYAPDLQFTYPARLGVLKLRWNEVAP